MDSRDYISTVPDEILGKILSLLWTNRAACTSVLSKRWRNLLVLVENLEFNDGAGDPHGFCDFVEKTLSLLRNSPPIKRFSLTLSHDHDHDVSRVNSWIRTALDLGCLALYLESVALDCTETKFMSNTLVELKIHNWHSPKVRLLPGSMIFPALKTLSLKSVEFANLDMLHDFISGFPVLEDLFLYSSEDEISPFWSGDVLNPSIKRLTIFNHYPSYPEAHYGCLFKTPSLEYLDYTSYVEEYYELDFASLVEARLDLLSWERSDCKEVWDNNIWGNVTDLVAGISNVKTLHLSANSLDALHFCCDSVPIFHNLLSLSFESNKEIGWQVLPLLLNNSPNLHTLIIKGLVHQVTNRCGNACACIPKEKENVEEEVCCLSTCQVKVLNISGYRGTCTEMKQMRHFLANLKCLETVQVGVKVTHQEDNSGADNQYLRITDALLKLPRVSSNCQIRFIN